jgi:hypothetical protein
MDLRAEIKQLSIRDNERKVFGAMEHKYHLNEVLTEAELHAFEANHAISLPADYRDYLKETGYGIAGPFHGVFRLGEVDGNRGFQAIEDSLLVGRLGQTFPHTTAWNLTASELAWPNLAAGTPVERQHAIIAERDERLEASYWGEHIMNGCLPICHRGCALRVWLVITGPMAGTVWNDDRADNLGLYPVLDREGRAMNFAQWMRAWVDEPSFYTSALVCGRPAA